MKIRDYAMIYDYWSGHAFDDADIQKELRQMRNNSKQVKDAFFKELEFGTGGLRGEIGAGTNRINIYTIGKVTQGLADYLNECCKGREITVAIGYDSRIKSRKFAETAAGVLAANRIKVYFYRELVPTPCVSYAVRHLHCNAGIMITASHNPAKYNGYKVYGEDGCQITIEAAEAITEKIKYIDVFNGTKRILFREGHDNRSIRYIDDNVMDRYIEQVKRQALLPQEDIDRTMPIIYSPLNGTGLKPVLRVLEESGFTNIRVVREQEQPDGSFPTCPYPNPEMEEAMRLSLAYAEKYQAELLLATDPDCDRVGIGVRDEQGRYVLLSGNETGLLLLEYICARRSAAAAMPQNPVLVKTIVTTGLAERVAAAYGVETINVLTGFKFIGEEIGRLEREGRENSYVFGFEESYGYLSGTYVRDKDGVNAALLICEMFAYYQARGISLWEKLQQLYQQFGYCLQTLHSYEYEGAEGFDKMKQIMAGFRCDIKAIGGVRIKEVRDYQAGLEGLPKADVLKLVLENDAFVVIRPSGTEPKIKVYITVMGADQKVLAEREHDIVAGILCQLE